MLLDVIASNRSNISLPWLQSSGWCQTCKYIVAEAAKNLQLKPYDWEWCRRRKIIHYIEISNKHEHKLGTIYEKNVRNDRIRWNAKWLQIVSMLKTDFWRST